jgi:hypothetical protein
MRPYEDSVFINVPFDRKYARLGNAIVFAVYDCGFVCRSALEIEDSGQTRVDKILDIIEQSKFGIHDISRAGIDRKTRVARFNMIARPTAIAVFAQTFRARTFESTTTSRVMRSAPYAIG